MKAGKEREKSRFPKSIFWILLGILLLTAGVHEGMIIGMDKAGWAPIVQAHVMVFYWLGTALLLTFMLRSKMRDTYEKPLQAISEATKEVAAGDFSVRIDSIHDESRQDYLDVMIRDLNTMIAELGTIETLKTDFISNISHEIKTPLAIIQNYAKLLQSDTLTEEERREYSAAISDTTARLSTLITNILKLNRLENQEIGLATEPFDLSAQLAECLLGFEAIWEEQGIEIAPQIEDDVMVNSDRELLAIVWNNLLSNAFKFTDAGGTVSVTLDRRDGEACVTVRDTGCGISPEALRHIFDKFYQEDTSHAAQGNGLGLALVSRILDMLGGRISVESTPGEGSAFTVRLKAAQ